MEGKGSQPEGDISSPQASRITLQPLSDMTEFEPKPYTPQAAESPVENKTTDQQWHSTEPQQVSNNIPPMQLSPEEAMKVYEENKAQKAQQLPKRRVIERVTLLNLYVILNWVFMAIPVCFLLINVGRFLSAGLGIGSLVSLYYFLPILINVAILIFLSRTKSATAASIVLTVLFAIAAVGMLGSVAFTVYLATKGFPVGRNFLGFVVSGFLLYFLFKVRQATAAAK